MMTRGSLKRMIGRSDTRERGNVREFPDPGVRDIRVAVAIAVIAQAAVLHAAALANFHKGTKFGIGDLAIGVDERLLAQTWHEDYSPLINLLRNQPDRLSMAMTIKITKVM